MRTYTEEELLAADEAGARAAGFPIGNRDCPETIRVMLYGPRLVLSGWWDRETQHCADDEYRRQRTTYAAAVRAYLSSLTGKASVSDSADGE